MIQGPFGTFADHVDTVNDPGEVSLDENISRESYFVWNETSKGENFAGKWGDDSGRAGLFTAGMGAWSRTWHSRANISL